MKRIVLTICAVLVAVVASAQSNYIVQTGKIVGKDGEVRFVEPKSTIVVDVTVERREVIVGPYARYAQKYLGVRAPLSGKDSFRVVGATIALADDDLLKATAEVAAPTMKILSHAGNERDYARLLPNRTDSRALTADEAAADAAAAIFALRKSRQELITAQAGENVFGGGLEAALREIDKYENAYLELFFGKEIISTSTERATLMPSGDKFNYVLWRFSDKVGLVPATDLSGEIVMLHIEPSGDTSLKYVTEAGEKDKIQIDCRVADFATCVVSCGTEPIAQRVLPLFEYGRSFKVAK
ncbi:MAG: DUF4831 family protein [Rikenellaceae bacterium]|nr:DUF4831 family protein [Rikenellaceae bacterium]